MTGSWTPSGTWHRIHGDCKSTTGGRWHLETMTTSDGGYKVRLMDNGSTHTTKQYTGKEPPSFSQIVEDLQKDLG